VSIAEAPASPIVDTESVTHAQHIVRTAQILTAAKEAALAENDRLKRDIEERDEQIVRLEQERDALLESYFARQMALAEPATVRETRLLGQLAQNRTYIARIERLLDDANGKLTDLEQAARVDAAHARPTGRRRRSR